VSKTIKLEEKVYNELRSILYPHETFNQGVSRLLGLYWRVKELSDITAEAWGYPRAKPTVVADGTVGMQRGQ